MIEILVAALCGALVGGGAVGVYMTRNLRLYMRFRNVVHGR